jgi:hypothetical protein
LHDLNHPFIPDLEFDYFCHDPDVVSCLAGLVNELQVANICLDARIRCLNISVAHICPDHQSQTARAERIAQNFRGSRAWLLVASPPSGNDIDNVFRCPEKLLKLTK